MTNAPVCRTRRLMSLTCPDASFFFCVFKENVILIGLWKRHRWRGRGLVDLLSCKRWCFLTLINLVSDLVSYLFFKFSESQLSFILPGFVSLCFCCYFTFNMQALNFYFLNFLIPEFVRWPPVQHGINDFLFQDQGLAKWSLRTFSDEIVCD